MATADLHFHSTHSDGKHSIDWVAKTLEKAKSHGLELGVLTDHDGVAGFEEFAGAIKHLWKPICASELSCTFDVGDAKAKSKDRELHLLVYGLNPADSELKEKFTQFKNEREARFFKICDKLTAAGFPVDGKKFAAEHPGVLGRPHIADALVEAGYVHNRASAFERFLRDDSRFFVKKWRFPLSDAVHFARSKSCKTSVAHPGQYYFKEKELQFFKDTGVDAIEVYHPRHTREDTEYYLKMAKYFGFFISGGSDFHSSDTDVFEEGPSLGRTHYPFEDAKRFLGDLL